MKKLCSVILALSLLFILSACSEAETAVCSYCSAKMNPDENYCPSCGKPLSSMRPDGYEDAMDEYETNPFEGVWTVEADLLLAVSFDKSNMYVFDLNSESEVYNYYESCPYNFTDDELSCTVTYDDSYTETFSYSYTFSDNSSVLTVINDEGEKLKLKKVLDASSDKSIVGHWTTYTYSDIYLSLHSGWNKSYSISEIYFYKDGTYQLITSSSEHDPNLNGNYQIVNDGKAFRFVNGDTHEITIFNNGLMMLNDQYDVNYLLKRVD